MRTRKHQFSFASGELSPEMYGRADAAQYQTGLASAKNFIIKPQGSARTRPGFELVRRSHTSSAAAPLIPFKFSNTEAYAVEMSVGAIRFHTDGGTVLWAAPVNVGELGSSTTLDANNNMLITEASHGLVEGDTVRATVSPGGTLPGGVSSFVDFRVVVVDARRIQLCTVAGYPTPTTLGPSFGDGFMRLFKTADLPRRYIYAKQFTAGDVNTALDTINIGLHEYQVNDEVTFGGAGLPSPLVAAVTYYVQAVTSNTIKVSTTVGGAAVNMLTTGSGTNNVSFSYKKGDLAFVWQNGGLFDAGTVVYHLRDNSSDILYPNTMGDCYAQPGDGVLTLPSPYTAAQLFAINYDQSGDVVTLVHPEHPERELRRLSATKWLLADLEFGITIAAPVVSVTPDYGERIISTSVLASAAPRGSRFQGVFQGLASGDALLCTSATYPLGTFSGNGLTAGDVYVVNATNGTYPSTDFELRELDGVLVLGDASAGDNTFAFTDLIRDDNVYVVSAVDARGVESPSSPSAVVKNNLSNSGASNTLTWAAIAGAIKYRIYKRQSGSGLAGFVGESTTTSFIDTDLPADLGNTVPAQNTKIASATNYSRATARFEQSRCFAGSDENRRTMFMSRKGTESDFSERFPVLDDDAIEVDVDARESQTVMHIVPLDDLLLITDQAEWRVFAINSDAITPNTINVRPQSYVGSTFVRPLIVNSTVLYCAARGGHVREMGFDGSVQRFRNGDVSLRAAHLFDGFELRSGALSKAPAPVAWWVSTSGKLLGLTYVPEEQIGAWHQHETDGTIESVCVIPDGVEDRVYVTVLRRVNGVLVRNVERMGVVQVNRVIDTVCLDASQRFDGTGAGTVTLTGGSFTGDTVTVTASALSPFSLFYVGARIIVTDGNGVDYSIDITEFTSKNVVKGRLRSPIPSTVRDAALSRWAIARRTIRNIGLQEGGHRQHRAHQCVVTRSGRRLRHGDRR